MQRNKIAVIFDMDGVLVDSVALNWRAINQALAPYNIKVEDDHIANYLGKTLLDQAKQLKNEYHLELSYDGFEAAVIEAKLEIFKTLAAKEGVVEFVELLKAKGIPYAVATSSTSALAKERLELAGLLNQFTTLITADHVTKHKPDPAVYLEAARVLNVEPGYCVVFEDAPAGVQAAKAAGMACIAISSPYVDVGQLSTANLVVSSLRAVTLSTLESLL